MIHRKKIHTEYKSDIERNDRHTRENESEKNNRQRTKNSRINTTKLSDNIFYASIKSTQSHFNSSHT